MPENILFEWWCRHRSQYPIDTKAQMKNYHITVSEERKTYYPPNALIQDGNAVSLRDQLSMELFGSWKMIYQMSLNFSWLCWCVWINTSEILNIRKSPWDIENRFFFWFVCMGIWGYLSIHGIFISSLSWGSSLDKEDLSCSYYAITRSEDQI